MATKLMSGAAITFENLAWVHDSPTTLSCRPKPLSAGKVLHGRRSHKKSRLGCGNCKRRHVKCDETRPKCEKCVQQRMSCDYLKLLTPLETESEAPERSPWDSAATASMSADLFETQLQGIIKPWRSGKLSNHALRSAGNTLIEVLHHFVHIASSTIGTPQVQQRMRTRVLSLAQDSPILMNAVFAFSANHLHTLRPDDKKLQITARHHRQVAVDLYTTGLAGTLAVRKVDAMIAACLLVSAIVFFAEDTSPSSSFVFSDDPHAADWLRHVAGLATLLNREDARAAMSQSIWTPVFTGGGGGGGHGAVALESGARGLPPAFVELCHVEDDSTAENNPYHAELRLLSRMTAAPAGAESFATLIQFPCRMNPAFTVLLREKDPVALLMLAHWFATIGGLDYWWLGARARGECFAICSYLDGWPDERFAPLLESPMQACGYVPIDLDLIEACVFGM